MTNKIATDLEQSIKLAELGIDPDTADMHWESVYNEEYRLASSTTKEATESIERMQDSLKTTFNVKLVPAWSLSALISLMPKGFVLAKESITIDAVFEMIIHLKENKLI